MNSIKKILIFSLIAFFSVTAYAKDKYVLKFATIAPEGTTWMNIMKEMSDDIEKTSDGKLKLRFYPGGVMGDEVDVLRKMRINQIHGAGFSGVGLGEIVPDVRVLDLPFLFRDYNEVDYVHNQLLDKFLADFDKKGYILMGWAEVGFVHLFSKSEIKNMADLRQVKLWAWQSDPIAKNVFSSMKISTIPLAVTDVLTSLQVGIIDTVYSPPLGALALQWYTRVKHMCSFPLTHSSGAVLVSKKFYDKLPPDLQIILKEKFSRYLSKLIVEGRKDNLSAVETLKKNGIKVTQLSDGEKKNMMSESATVSKELAGKLYSEDIYKKVLNLIKSVRKKNDN